MKKNYENPKVEIIEIGMKDVITVSGNNSQTGEGTGMHSLEDELYPLGR